ncbi:3991_t:CDS:2, partial [Acaulospora colombiana]
MDNLFSLTNESINFFDNFKLFLKKVITKPEIFIVAEKSLSLEALIILINAKTEGFPRVTRDNTQPEDLDELVSSCEQCEDMKKIRQSSILAIPQRYSMIVPRSTYLQSMDDDEWNTAFHSELDDQFFNLAEFNETTGNNKSFKISPHANASDEDDIDYFT